MSYPIHDYNDPRWQQYEHYRYWDNYYRYYYGLSAPDRAYQDYNNYYYHYGHGYDWNYWKQMHDYYTGSYSNYDPNYQTRLSYHFGQHQTPWHDNDYNGYPQDWQQQNTNHFSDAYGVAGEELNEIDDDNEGEEEEPSFTLNEEFLEYLRKSEKRRRERKEKQRKRMKEEEDQMMLGVKIKEVNQDVTVTDKYGDDTEEIEQLETQLELSFNTYADKKHPVLWPILPLNLSFACQEN